MKKPFLLIFFIFLLISFNFSINAQALSENTVLILDEEGQVSNFKGNYLIRGDEFFLILNQRISHINYSQGNYSYFNDKTISRFHIFPVYDNSVLTIKDNNDTVVFRGRILRNSFGNFLNYGAGQYINNNFLLAPVAIIFAGLLQGTHKLYYRRRVI